VLRFERPFEMGYSVNCDEYKRNLSPEVKLVLLTNLHNPSGAWLSPHILEEMAVRAKSEKAALVVDEIYLEFLESQAGHTSFHLGDNIIVISSLTKVFGLGDLRCGWVLASPDVVRKMKIIQDHSIVEGVFISEWISAGIFDRLDAFRKKNEFRIRANLSEIKSFIENQAFLDWVEPAGGVICFPRINTGLTGDDLARILDAEFDIAIVPGSLFEDERHFRLGFDADPDDLAFALETIRRILKRY
jgi:aspartate/methionine/tyrosine aminotransferase